MTDINVKHIARLANIHVTDEETAKFEKQLSEVLDMISKLNEVDTTAVEPTSQVTGLENVLRDDSSMNSLTQQESLSNASAQHDGKFMVKGIFDEE